MTKKELYELGGFDVAINKLIDEGKSITTYNELKEFAIYEIENNIINVALHILQAIWNSSPDAEYYLYDYSSGTLETPIEITCCEDLEQFCQLDDSELCW